MTTRKSGTASQPSEFAYYEPSEQRWLSSAENACDLFQEQSPPFSDRWPKQGMTRNGRASELPTSALPTNANASSFWPETRDWQPQPIPLTPETAWAAGLFEGEGYISSRQNRYKQTPMMGLQMTDKDVVERFAATIGVGRIKGPYAQKGIGTKPTWRWTTWANDDVETVLNRLWLGLGIRRRARAVEVMTLLKQGSKPHPEQPELLPTPVAMDAVGARNATSSRQPDSRHHAGTTLTDAMWELAGETDRTG